MSAGWRGVPGGLQEDAGVQQATKLISVDMGTQKERGVGSWQQPAIVPRLGVRC